MQAAPSAKPRRGSPPIPPNYVSLRQLQELRLKENEEQEKRQREEDAAAAAAAAAAMAKRDAPRKPEMKVSAVVPVAHVRAKERRQGGLGGQWITVAHRPAVPLPARREAVPEAVPIGAGRGSKGPAHASRGGGKPERKPKVERKEKVSAIASAQTRTADEPGKPAEDSSHGGKPENKGSGKGKSKAKKAVSGDEDAEGSIGGSGELANASSRHHKNRKWKKGAGGRSAEPSADNAPAKTAGASPPQGVKPENTGKPKSPAAKRADASPVSDSSHRKKADATPATPASVVAGSVGELRIAAETKPEGLMEARSRPPAVEVQGAAEQKPRVMSRRAWPRSPGDRCNGAGEPHGRVWVPKAAAGCTEP